LRTLFFKILYLSRLGDFLLQRNQAKSCVPVLVFHKIMPEYDAIWPGIHPHLFESMILLLKKHYTILPLSYLYDNPGIDLTKACFITFDDGYKNYLDYAYPILKRNNTHSTLFVLPYNLSNHGHIWTSTIIYLVKHYSLSEIREFFAQHHRYIDYNGRADEFNLNLNITKHLCRLTQLERQGIIDDLQDKFVKDSHVIETELLSFEELRKLDKNVCEIASHSFTHPSFMLETNESFIDYEMRESKHSIEKELDVEVSFFAFPFANYNSLSLRKVKQYYKMCFTRINDFVDLKKLEKDKEYYYDLPRFIIHHDSAEEVFFLINGFHKRMGA
jgi:peptidoglycan/xylan/chitin deacetylase (PgdA/CDA1 family)